METKEQKTNTRTKTKSVKTENHQAPVSAPIAETELPVTEIIEKKRQEQLTVAATEGMLGPNPVVGLSTKSIFDTLYHIALQAMKQPALTIQHSLSLFSQFTEILQGTSKLSPEKKDMRFEDSAWKDNPFLERTMKSYLAIRNQINSWIETSDFDDNDKQRAKYIMALFTEAYAPSNAIFNPAAVKRAIDTGGLSVVNGLKNMLGDLVENNGMPSQVNKKIFKVGKNLAISKGAVVFKNEVLEVIQYNPSTEKVHEKPLLVIPPQINKFYLFDITPQKSLAQHLVKNNIQTFIVSWRNPTAKQRDWGMKQYIDALEEAIDAVLDITGSEDLNVAGACSGGITLATLLGNQAYKKSKKINSATLMVSVLDVHIESENGTPLRLFATDDAIELARKRSEKQGVLSGEEMAHIFSWMRPNDLIWGYWVNNYLMGNPPPIFDVLYWNADTTQLPAKLHGEFLDLYKINPMAKPEETKEIAGIPVDITNITQDMFYVSGVTDHITPWEGCYQSSRLFKGDIEFILSTSGHIQSIINPPGNPKSSYFISKERKAPNAKEWLATAEQQPGSWWDFYMQWLAKHGGQLKPAPEKLGNEKYKELMAAPGQYCLE